MKKSFCHNSKLLISIVLAVSLLMTSVPNAFAATINTASISGVVTGQGGTPLPGILVLLYKNYERISTANTDTNGQYSFGGLSSGSYRMLFSPTSYNQKNGTTYAYQRSPYSSTSLSSPITLSDGQSLSINTQLENAGFISGKVYDPNGKALTGIMVCEVYEGSTYGRNYTNTSGEYIINQLPAENYKIHFDPAEHNAQYGTDYLEQWYNNKPGSNLADEVAVIQGQTINADAYLQISSGTVSGLKAKACGNQISLSWSAFPGAQSYSIYRTSRFFGINYQKIDATTSSSYTDSNLPLSTGYWYKVKPVTAIGEGSFSAPVRTKTGDTIITDPGVIISTVAGNGTAGYSGDGGPATSAQLNTPRGVVCDGAGNLYIVDGDNQRIRKVDTSGKISTVAGNGTHWFEGDGGPATAAGLYDPIGVACDSSGNLYIAESNSNCIRKVDSSGKISVVAGIVTQGWATYEGDGGLATSARLNYPFGVACDGSGNLYIADRGNHRIRKVDTSGIISTVAGNGTAGYSGDGGPATSAQLKDPVGVACDRNGNLYIVDKDNNRIRKVDNTGKISTVAGNGTGGYAGDGSPATSAQIWVPYGVTFDNNGNMYIADMNNKRIRKVDPSGIITTVAGNGSWKYSGDGGPAEAAGLCNAVGVACDSSGNLYIADSHSNCIRKVVLGTTPNNTITFPDSNLEAAIRETLDKPTEDILNTDIENITELALNFKGLTSLEGIQHFTSLQTLYLAGNGITDLTPLQSLRNLQYLDISNNAITDLGPLTKLSNLQGLDFSYNQLTDIQALANLTDLRYLDFSYNDGVGVLEPLRNLIGLTDLFMAGIRDSNPAQVALCSVSSNQSTNIGAILAGLKNLENLDISNNELPDITFVNQLPNLKTIDASNNTIVDTTPLETLSNLEKVSLYNNNITSISSLVKIPSLQEINISGNQVGGISQIEQLANLTKLDLTANPISDLTPLTLLQDTVEVNHEEFTEPYTSWEERTDIPINRTWKIEFSHAVDTSTVNPDTIVVKEQNNQPVTVNISRGDTDNTVLLEPPAGGYKAGQCYYLFIKKGIGSSDGKVLQNNIRMKFTIAGTDSLAGHKLQSLPIVIQLVGGVLTLRDFCIFTNNILKICDQNKFIEHFIHKTNFTDDLPLAKAIDNPTMLNTARNSPHMFRQTLKVLNLEDKVPASATNDYLQDIAKEIGRFKLCSFPTETQIMGAISDTVEELKQGFVSRNTLTEYQDEKNNVNYQVKNRWVILPGLRIEGTKTVKVGQTTKLSALANVHYSMKDNQNKWRTVKTNIDASDLTDSLWAAYNNLKADNYNPSDIIATVTQDGTVTGYNPGKVKIAVMYGGKLAICTIKVVK
jgi:internalin A